MTSEHGYITVIFCAEKGETVSDIIRTKDWSIASWSNAIHERDALKAELEAALSQAEADRVDAERYRFMRQEIDYTDNGDGTGFYWHNQRGDFSFEYVDDPDGLFRPTFESVIDAARLTKEQP